MTTLCPDTQRASGIRQRVSEAFSVSYAAPDALRAARALVGLTQAQLAASIGVSRRSVAACEGGPGATLKTIAALRDSYERSGIEFLGVVNLTTNEIHGSGACWKIAPLFSRCASSSFPGEANFFAARALLGLEEREVAREAGLTPRQIRNLESGRSFTRKGYDRLRGFFEESGVEFLSFRTGVRDYIGLGVRAESNEACLHPGLWANREAR
ncbi:Hypothetical protein NGAL_HAMBI1146_00470 [Neorhizobium galegae bv. officinalis]|nr:Hypothetical protein NGAL_HAMBI1146_00470 [Neorhizobium galegae bv. officinalis]